MKRSLNEIEQTCRKAARGCGLPWGVADETGKAVRWLHVFGIDGVSSLTALLKNHDHHCLGRLSPDTLDGVWTGKGGVLSPITAGMSLCDCMERMKKNRIQAEHVLHPVLIAGFLGQSALTADKTIALSLPTVSCTLHRNALIIRGDREELYKECVDKMECKRTLFPNEKALRPVIGDTGVNSEAWETLQEYAYLTYVKATDEARLSGAGAGLNDND